MEQTNLEELRRNLNLLDHDLISILEKRAGIARQIWSEKKQSGANAAFCPVREAEIFQALRTYSSNTLPQESLEQIFVEIISACRAIQNETQICLLGEKFGWINDAAVSRYGNNINLTAADNFEDFMAEINKSPANIGFASFSPQHAVDHNSLIETLFSGKLGIVEEFNFSPEFSVVSNSVRDLSEIREICVTSEMLQLMRHFFISLSFDLKIRICRSMSEAYESLQSVNPVAAILPSHLISSNKDMRVIKSGLRSESTGQIKFLSLSPAPSQILQPGLKTTLLCALNQTSERLFDIMSVLRHNNIQVCDIHSLRYSGKPWETILIIEILVPETRTQFDSIIKDLETKCMLIKACGFYSVFR